MNEQDLFPQNTPRKSFIQRNPISVKITLIGALILILYFPVNMVKGLINERETTAVHATSEVHEKWSSSQNIIGPVLTIPYYEKVEKNGNEKNDEKVKKVKEYLHLLPETLDIKGNLNTQDLKRGLHEIVVYNAPVRLTGQFIFPESIAGIAPEDMLYEEATLNMGITDMRGISEQVAVQWNGDTLVFNPGLESNHFLSSGISTRINMSTFTKQADRSVNFEINIKLKGSESINFAPLGKTTSVALTSNCLTPSFSGAFLPEQRDVNEKGFTSSWKVLNLNRNYSQLLSGNKWDFTISQSIFGVNLLIPVQQYQKSMRSVKYALLVIVLTFVVSFFAEIMQKKNIHPFQYLLVGLALCLFYTLLVAISEHLGFTLSYAIAAMMTIILLTFYMTGVLKVKKTAFMIGELLTFLYIYIFILIQMETYALLAGSIGLFVILAIVMYYSQKINWNNTQEQ